MHAFIDALTIMIAKSADDPDDMAQMSADIIVTDVALRTAKGVA
jgi:hypothetical protein